PFSRRFLMGTTSRSGYFLNRARSMQKHRRMLIVSLLVLTSCVMILGISPFSQLRRMLIVSLLVLTSCVMILGISPFSQHAKAQASQRVTVAGVDPSLVAGRGAQLGIVEQEAENATTNGTILPYDTTAYTLSSEA